MNRALGLLLQLCITLPAATACGTQSSPTIYDVNSTVVAYIKTPNYPGYYPDSVSCYWLVRVPSGSVGYSFSSDFRLESQSFCAYDYVKLYDSSVETTNILDTQLIGTYCGIFAPSSGLTSGRYLYVVFRSDGSNNYKGFKLGVTGGYIQYTPPDYYYPDITAGAIIGIIIGGLGFLVLCALFVYCCCCSQKGTRGAVIGAGSRSVGPTGVVTVTLSTSQTNQVHPMYYNQPSSSGPGVYPPLNAYPPPPPDGVYPPFPPGQYPPPPPGQYQPPPPYTYPPPPAYK